MKYFTTSEFIEELKNYDSSTLVFVHVFPSFDIDVREFYSYICDIPSAIALTAIAKSSNNLRFTYKIKL